MITAAQLSRRLATHFPQLAARLTSPHLDLELALPPCSEAEIRAIEHQAGAPLPASYQRFLACTRGFHLLGGRVQLGTLHPFAHLPAPPKHVSVAKRIALRLRRTPRPPPGPSMICFAECCIDDDGDQALFDTSKGLRDGEYPVLYYAHGDSPPSVRPLAANFASFINTIADRPEFQPEDDAP